MKRKRERKKKKQNKTKKKKEKKKGKKKKWIKKWGRKESLVLAFTFPCFYLVIFISMSRPRILLQGDMARGLGIISLYFMFLHISLLVPNPMSAKSIYPFAENHDPPNLC